MMNITFFLKILAFYDYIALIFHGLRQQTATGGTQMVRHVLSYLPLKMLHHKTSNINFEAAD